MRGDRPLWTRNRVDLGLDHRPGFKESFAMKLPRLRAGEISQAEAARLLGVSVQSWKRYVRGRVGKAPEATEEQFLIESHLVDQIAHLIRCLLPARQVREHII